MTTPGGGVLFSLPSRAGGPRLACWDVGNFVGAGRHLYAGLIKGPCSRRRGTVVVVQPSATTGSAMSLTRFPTRRVSAQLGGVLMPGRGRSSGGVGKNAGVQRKGRRWERCGGCGCRWTVAASLLALSPRCRRRVRRRPCVVVAPCRRGQQKAPPLRGAG